MNDVQILISSVIQDYAPTMDVWKQHNCPACVAKGQSRPDSRGRGNHYFGNDGCFLYNCFNCGIKVKWVPGSFISRDFELLLESYNITSKDLMTLQLLVKDMKESGLYKNENDYTNSSIFQRLVARDLPDDAISFRKMVEKPADQIPQQFISVLTEIDNRNPYLLDLDLYWSPSKVHKMYDRFIIPYYLNNNIIGYTARHKDKNNYERYFNQVSTSIFYNFDLLNDSRIKVIFVCEGALDAALLGGIGSNNFKLNAQQIEQLEKARDNGKKIVIVPDRDKDGLITIGQALEYNFSVSLPDFGTIRTVDGIRYVKDFEEAVSLYGRLFAAQLVYNSIYNDEFEIKVYTNKWI